MSNPGPIPKVDILSGLAAFITANQDFLQQKFDEKGKQTTDSQQNAKAGAPYGNKVDDFMLAVVDAIEKGQIGVGPLNNPVSLEDPATPSFLLPAVSTGLASAIAALFFEGSTIASASTRFAGFIVGVDPKYPPPAGAAPSINGFTNPGGDILGADMDTTGTTIGDFWVVYGVETATGYRFKAGAIQIVA